MNSIGSTWAKWDLHVHTPNSIVQAYKSDWERFIQEIESLPPEFKVLGVNDYIFLNGYEKILSEKRNGRLKNIELFLPVIELRLDKFGGTDSKLSRLNFHIIFSNELSAEIIKTQFIGGLITSYQLTPAFDHLRENGKWAAVPTEESIKELGRLIIQSVPEKERGKFGNELEEGFNNLCFNHSKVMSVLSNPIFRGKYLTAIGKTEWADIKWKDQSIADKKTVINQADLVFTAAQNEENFDNALNGLRDAGVNYRLFDCSDAHHFSDAVTKDRIGNCLTWLKSERTFEGLKHALYEYDSRVLISESEPIEPIYKIEKVLFNFPNKIYIEGADNTRELFCYSGTHEINFSPYFNCIIGGRGTGKSTLLKLINAKINQTTASIFESKRFNPDLDINDITLLGNYLTGSVEYLEQNSIEQFARDQGKLTDAVIHRLKKLDIENSIESTRSELESSLRDLNKKLDAYIGQHILAAEKENLENDLRANEAIVASFNSDEYKELNKKISQEIKLLKKWEKDKYQYEQLNQDLQNILETYGEIPEQDESIYKKEVVRILDCINSALKNDVNEDAISETTAKIAVKTEFISSLRVELRSYLERKGLKEENLIDVGRASTGILDLGEKIEKINKQLEGMAQEADLKNMESNALNNYVTLIERLINPINTILDFKNDEYLKPIKLSYSFDNDKFNDEVISIIASELSQYYTKQIIASNVQSKISISNFSSLPNYKQFYDQLIIDKTQTSIQLQEYFSDEFNYDKLRLKIKSLSHRVDDFWSVCVSYDNKPLQDCSFGQRCTAVIVILLLLGNNPIIIDEPEAHLDSALIANYLVEKIKERKIQRQIIFATHNANFVINGDAELINVLEITEKKISTIKATTIENLKNRHMLLNLEGGEEAFAKREKRYDIAH